MASVQSTEIITIVIATAGAVVAGFACLLAACLIHKANKIYNKVFDIDIVTRAISRDLTQNLQQINLLHHELKLDRPLPPLRGWAASPDILLVVTRHVREAAPDVIVECGSGTSTVALAQAAKLNGRGHVYSIDHDGAFADESRALLARYGLSEWATVTHAPLRDIEIAGTSWEWYEPDRLPDTPPIDLLFVDGPPAGTAKPLARYPAGPMLFPRLSPHGVVFADDTSRPGETEVLRRWAKEFPHLEQLAHFCEKGCHELRAAGGQRPVQVAATPSAPPEPDRPKASMAMPS